MSTKKTAGRGKTRSRATAGRSVGKSTVRAGASVGKKIGVTLASLFIASSLACGAAGIVMYAKAEKEAEKVTPPAAHEHVYKGGMCEICGAECVHVYEQGVCTICGEKEPGKPVDPDDPPARHEHTWENGVCIECGETCEHSYTEGVCTVCGQVQVSWVYFYAMDGGVKGTLRNLGSEGAPALGLEGVQRNEETGLYGVEVVYGAAVEKPTAPTIEGNTFKGWYYMNDEHTAATDSEFDFNSLSISASTYLVAVYDPVIYTVYYRSDSGVIQESKVPHGSTLYSVWEQEGSEKWNVIENADGTQSYVPYRKGYTFDGWCELISTGEIKFVDPYEPVLSQPAVLFGKWTQNTYIVSFINDGVATNYSVKHGNLVSEPETPVKEGYDFGGWFTDEAYTEEFDFETPITGDLTLYAKWLLYYTVTFRVNGGSAVPSQKVYEGEPVLQPEESEREGYDFGGWYTDEACTEEFDFETPITGDLTLYAKWLLYYTVTFQVNGGSEVPVQKVYEGELVVQPDDPAKEGYTFIGWYTSATLRAKFQFTTVIISADRTLYARWSQNSYVVSFMNDGVATTVSVGHGDLISAPETPVKEGFVFGGWFTDEACTEEFDFTTPITQARTLYAKWTFDKGDGVTKRYIVFDANGGHFADGKGAINAALDEEGNLTAETLEYVQSPEHDNLNLTFSGWYVDRDLLVECDLSGSFETSGMLTARWDYTVTIVPTEEPTEDLRILIESDTVPLGTHVVVKFDPANEGYANALSYFAKAYLVNEGNQDDSDFGSIPWLDEFDFNMSWDWVEIVYELAQTEEETNE